MESIFCPKCHRLTGRIERGNGSTKIIQNGKVLISLSDNITLQGSKISLKCPVGHSAVLDGLVTRGSNGN